MESSPLPVLSLASSIRESSVASRDVPFLIRRPSIVQTPITFTAKFAVHGNTVLFAFRLFIVSSFSHDVYRETIILATICVSRMSIQTEGEPFPFAGREINFSNPKRYYINRIARLHISPRFTTWNSRCVCVARVHSFNIPRDTKHIFRGAYIHRAERSFIAVNMES